LEGLQPNSSRKPTDFMTAPPKRASSQEGFFWKTKTLEEMSSAEWESLCDGCARCCLEKLEDEDTGKIYFTHVSCKLLDSGLCACKDYQNRSDKVPDCVRLTPENVRTLTWLPPSCGYKLVAKAPSRDAPMRAGVCRGGNLRFIVQRIWRFHPNGPGRAEQYYVRHEQAPTAGPRACRPDHIA